MKPRDAATYRASRRNAWKRAKLAERRQQKKPLHSGAAAEIVKPLRS